MNEFTDFKTYKMKNQKTYQYVFDYFSEQILSGELKINDKILPEREIAEKLDVSRNSIREVMHMLEINGLLDCRQGSGNYLRCEPQDYMVKFMNMVMSLQQIKYTEVYDIRMGYETVALRLAIKNATEEEIEEMHQILIKMDEIEDPKESGKLDMQFHNKLIEASHNPHDCVIHIDDRRINESVYRRFSCSYYGKPKAGRCVKTCPLEYLRFLSGQRLCSRKLRNAAAF